MTVTYDVQVPCTTVRGRRREVARRQTGASSLSLVVAARWQAHFARRTITTLFSSIPYWALINLAVSGGSPARADSVAATPAPEQTIVFPAGPAQASGLYLFTKVRSVRIISIEVVASQDVQVVYRELPIGGPDPVIATFGSPRAPDGSGFAGRITSAGLSLTGAITGTTDIDGGTPQIRPSRAYRWTQDAGLVALPLPDGFANSSGTAISTDGSTVVGAVTSPAGTQQAFRWTAALGAKSLGPATFTATGVDADGSVVVGNTSGSFDGGAFRWDQTDATGNGTVTTLATLPPAAGARANARAFAVSTSGQVVVGTSQPSLAANSPPLPVRWVGKAAPENLGLAPGTTSAVALAVSGTGDVIVGVASTSAFDGSAPNDFTVNANRTVTLRNDSSANLTAARGFRWTQATGSQTLNDVARAGGIDTTGITFLSALGVSYDGQFIVGAAVFPTTRVVPGFTPEGYVLRICDATVAAACKAFSAGTPLQPAAPVASPPTPAPPSPAPAPTPAPTPTPTPPIVGLTTIASVQASIDRLGADRRAIMAQEHGFVAALLGENNRIIGPSSIGVFASAGSANGGATGRAALLRDVALIGGLSFGAEGYRSARIEDVFLIAAKLQFLHDLGHDWQLLVEAGGFWAPSGTYRFDRRYANGVGTATGTGRTGAEQTYFFGRLGGVADVGAADEVAVTAEAGRQALHTNAYDEPLTVTNPFDAHAAAARDRSIIAKVRAQWTHGFGRVIDATVWAAGAHAIDARNDLAVNVTGIGIGILTPDFGGGEWLEYGARAGVKASRRVTVDAFANGVSFGIAGATRVHFGADFRMCF